MFKMLTDAIENTIDVVTAPLYGEIPTKRQIAQLLSDGITIYTISSMTGVTVEILEDIMDD